MWFAHKGEAYRLGYAESDDGIRWQRDDSFAGVAPSASGWDSQMVEYAAVARHGDRYFMFYNGDNYGAGGIGLQVGRLPPSPSRSEEQTSELKLLIRNATAVL